MHVFNLLPILPFQVSIFSECKTIQPMQLEKQFCNFQSIQKLSVFLRDSEILVEFHTGENKKFVIHYYDMIILFNTIEDYFRHFTSNPRISNSFRCWPESKYISKSHSINSPLYIKHTYDDWCNYDQIIEILFASEFDEEKNQWGFDGCKRSLTYFCLGSRDLTYLFQCKNAIYDHMHKLMILRPLIVIVQIAISFTVKESHCKKLTPIELDTYIEANRRRKRFISQIKSLVDLFLKGVSFARVGDFHSVLEMIKLQRLENKK